MPAKRKAAAKAAPVESSRPSRSATATAKAGSKRKGSTSPAPPAKKGVGAKKAVSESEPPVQSRQSARGRAANKQEVQEEETPRGRGKSSHATRAAVEEVETKRAASRGRSKTPSTPKQTKATPKPSTPRNKTPTPSPRQTKGTPKQKAATPRQRSATPKSKPETPKQKAATPKSQKGTPKQKATPKQTTPKAKQKPTPKKATPKKEEPAKRATSRSRRETTEDETESPMQVSPKKSSPRKAAEKREITPSKQSSRSPRRSRGKEAEESEKKDEEPKDSETTVDDVSKEASDDAEITNDAVAEKKIESKEDGEDDQGNEEDNEDEEKEEDSKDEGEKETEDDNTEAMETDEVVKEDENVEQDQVVEESKPAQSEEDEAEEPEESEATEEQKVEAENVAPITEEQEPEVSAEKEPVEVAEQESEESAEKEIEDLTESQAESEQVESEDKECESAESEQVEADAPVEQSNKADTDPIVINEDSGDSVEAEVISDVSEKSEEVIELNEDSGDAVIVLDSKETDTGNQAEELSRPAENIQVQEESPSVVEIDSGAGIEMTEEAIENDVPSDSVGNGLDEEDDNESATKKRKLDEVEDVEDSGEFSKKSKTTVDVNNLENGTVSQEDNNDDDFVVIEMSDVPPTDSSEVKESIPKEIVTQSIANDLNPIFNRVWVPNPAFSGPGDALKQFSLVSYNILADCHLFRNDYSFTDKKYLVPEYRLEKILEELRYLDGDIICMQEVDPSFFSEKLLPSLQSIGYEGFHKKRTQEYYNEGEATFYKTSRFTIVEAQLHRQADLIEKVLAEGSVDEGVQAAVRKYVDMPDVLVVTRLRCNNTGAEITVGNVHINWGEMKTPDIQCVQIASAVREAVAKAGSDNVPHIICGDFNSPPLSPGYLVARDGYPSGDETITKLQQIMGLQFPEGRTDSLVNCLWPAFQHTSSSLKSAYNEVQDEEPSCSSYNKVMCDCVDYIFYSSTSIDNVGVYRVPSKEKIMETGGTPNLYFPSDHMSIKAVLSFK